jgi:hypothetical protein
MPLFLVVHLFLLCLVYVPKSYVCHALEIDSLREREICSTDSVSKTHLNPAVSQQTEVARFLQNWRKYTKLTQNLPNGHEIPIPNGCK